jgi:hypothetical protein
MLIKAMPNHGVVDYSKTYYIETSRIKTICVDNNDYRTQVTLDDKTQWIISYHHFEALLNGQR